MHRIDLCKYFCFQEISFLKILDRERWQKIGEVERVVLTFPMKPVVFREKMHLLSFQSVMHSHLMKPCQRRGDSSEREPRSNVQ